MISSTQLKRCTWTLRNQADMPVAIRGESMTMAVNSPTGMYLSEKKAQTVLTNSSRPRAT